MTIKPFADLDGLCRRRNSRVLSRGLTKNDETSLADLLDDAHDLEGVIGVEITRRLVRENDFRVLGDRPRDGDPLLLAAGKGLDVATAIVVHADALKDVVDPFLDLLFVVKTVHVETGLDILVDSFVRQEIVVLENVPDIFVSDDIPLEGILLLDQGAIEINLAPFEPVEPPITLRASFYRTGTSCQSYEAVSGK